MGMILGAAWGAPPIPLSRLPHNKHGVAVYPTPLMAVARTPRPIAAPHGGGMGIQSDLGYLAGFSGFTDMATGNFGFPGYRSHSIANVAFDNDKLLIQAHVPDPEGRKLRAHTSGDLKDDDTFELLIEPRGPHGKGSGTIFRVVGNAVGVWHADQDEQRIGQFHRPWDSGISYGSMIWDPTGGWMASVAIPWEKLGGRPADGAIWGIQLAVHYPDPKIDAVLSPTDELTDTARFARVRFDFNRRVNYRAHWMTEEMKSGTFVLGHLLANGDTKPQTVAVQVELYKGDKEIGKGDFKETVPGGSTYYIGESRLRLPSQPADSKDKDTVAHVRAYDRSHGNTLIYDQWVPYWRPEPGERDWLKERFGKDFTFNIGPYPSLGRFDYSVDAQTLCEVNPKATTLECVVLADGKPAKQLSIDLPKDGKVSGNIPVGKMADGVTYKLTATIKDEAGKTISEREESFTRHVMPFEKAAEAGLSDIVIAPFTAPKIEGNNVSCWGRTYEHGTDGLLEKLIAADQDLLAGPAVFKAVLEDGKTVVLKGDAAALKPHGVGMVDYAQTFKGGGIEMQVTGAFDYDGFYRFHTSFAAQDKPVAVKELRLEIPIKPEHATLIDAAVTWMQPGWEKSLGFLGTDKGRVWDSYTLPYKQGPSRTSNMPPWVWVGDDDRGLCYSNASDQGTHNDPKLPAAALDRSDQAVTMTIWLVNKPLELDKPRAFEFALQASPFKPLPANGRLWRNQPRSSGTYKDGVYFTNWFTDGAYPTYGRWLTLDYLKQKVDANGCDRTGMMGSAPSECSGTPEYEQFYYEWGSAMDQFKRFVAPVPADILTRFKESGVEANPFVMVEAASNTSRSNRDYRVWWMSEAAKHAGVSFLYQDNGTWVYYDRPSPEYGYEREDGSGIEPTSAIWNARTFMKRIAHAMTEAGQPSQPAVWPNLMSPVLPGRAFCGKALTGEYTNSDQLRMGMLRVHLSKQWGIVTDWLMQSPGYAGRDAGASRKYWRALCSQLFLLDITNFSRDDTAEVGRRWYDALDLFWLDDPTVQWHPYYRNPTLDSVVHPQTTFVSTYTAKGRMLAVVSNQDTRDVVESVRFKPMEAYGAGKVRYFYDAESGEEISVEDGALKLFVGGRNYRVVIGFTEPWKFAARNRLPHPESIPAQSAVDARDTISAICKALLTSRSLPALPGAHRLTEAWAREVLKQLPVDKDVIYLNARATADVDLGDPKIQCSVFYDRRREAMVIGYYNGTNQDRVLSPALRDKLAAKVGKKSYNYVYDVVGGEAQWSEIDVPAHSGRWEVCYPDSRDYTWPRAGVFKPGTLMSNILEAVKDRKAHMERP
jgi:hypothetical protein